MGPQSPFRVSSPPPLHRRAASVGEVTDPLGRSRRRLDPRRRRRRGDGCAPSLSEKTRIRAAVGGEATDPHRHSRRRRPRSAHAVLMSSSSRIRTDGCLLMPDPRVLRMFRAAAAASWERGAADALWERGAADVASWWMRDGRREVLLPLLGERVLCR